MWSQRDPSLRKSGTGNLFVKNLHPNVTHKDLYDAFSLFGNVLSCKVAVANDGKSKGYGYVHYEAEEAAKEAMSKMEDLSILDQKVDVQPFQRRDRRPDVVEWTNLYVKNVPLDWDDEKLNTLFGECGGVSGLAGNGVQAASLDKARPLLDDEMAPKCDLFCTNCHICRKPRRLGRWEVAP